MSGDDASSASGGRGRAESEDSADVVQHFWGVTVAPGKPYKMSMERTELHVTQVALAAKAVSKNPGAFAIVSASTEKIKEPVVLATLGGAGAGGSGARQALLDVSFFPTDEYATLHVHGDAPVCIAGSIAIYGGIIEVSEDEDEEEAAADGAESEEEADGEEAEGEDEEGDSDASDEDDGERAAAEAAAARKAAAAAAADAKKLSAVERMKRKREEGSAPSAAGAAEEAGARPAKQARTDKQQQPGGAASAAAGADAGAGKKQQQKQQQPEAKAKGGAGGKEAAAPAPAPGAAAASAGPQWKELANGLVKYMDLTPGMGPRPNKGEQQRWWGVFARVLERGCSEHPLTPHPPPPAACSCPASHPQVAR
jgi:pyruvate/2-oxoglutarate dehydrogenase complex dihydrolipoamide acyltransferase (E2) component